MVDEAGKDISRCLMIVAYVDKSTNRATDWPADTMRCSLKIENRLSVRGSAFAFSS